MASRSTAARSFVAVASVIVVTPARAERGARRGEVDRRTEPPYEVVGAPQPARRPAGRVALHAPVGSVPVEQAGRAQGGGVQHPQAPAAVLHPHGHGGDDRVERLAVEVTGDLLVVGDRAHRSAARRGAQRACEGRTRRHRRRPDVQRSHRRRERVDVHMVVVQAVQHGTALTVDHGVGGSRTHAGPDRLDHTTRDPHRGHPAPDLHGAQHEPRLHRVSLAG